jgi:uncharacterized protein (DUF427 family)
VRQPGTQLAPGAAFPRLGVRPSHRHDTAGLSSPVNEATMSSRPIKVPDARHPITVRPNPARVIVKAAGRVIADTRSALTLREATYPAVHYVPRDDVDLSQLQRTEHSTYCPYKGDCAYYAIPALGGRGENAAWTYESPFDAVAPIREHLAFYPDRVDSITEVPEAD